MASRIAWERSRACTWGAAVAAALLAAWLPAQAQQPDAAVPEPPTAPRPPDVMPEPPTPTPPAEMPEPPEILGEPPGYWRSPEAVYPWRYPYEPGFYPYEGYHRWDFHAPPALYRPRYRVYRNRPGRLVPRYGFRWYGNPW